MSAGGGDEVEEQVLRYSPALFPVSLDAHQYPAEEPTQTAVQQVLETLVAMEDGKPVGVLAESFAPLTASELAKFERLLGKLVP